MFLTTKSSTLPLYGKRMNQLQSDSTWQANSLAFLVGGNGSNIEILISIDGLTFISQSRSGERAEIQLTWDGAMEFVEWVHYRLPLPEG